MGKMAVLALLFCSWRCLLHVCLDCQKIGELCVIIGEPSLPVAVVSVDRHLSLRSRRRTSSASVLSRAGTTCNIYFTRSSGKEADFSFFLQLQSCPFTHASSVTNIFVSERLEGSAHTWVGRGKAGSHTDSVGICTLGALRTSLWKGTIENNCLSSALNILKAILK